MSQEPPKGQLNTQQKRFCLEYLKDLNGTKAAIRAGYSEKSATVQASRLLMNVNISDYCQVLMDERAARTLVDADWVITRLKQIAGADMSDVADWSASGVNFKDSSTLTDGAKASIQSVEETTNEHGGSLKIKQHDKIKALELLGKHLKLFTDVHEHKGKFTLEDLAAGSKDDESSA